MTFAKLITANWHGYSVEVELAPLTAFVGPMRTGKTSMLQAIRTCAAGDLIGSKALPAWFSDEARSVALTLQRSDQSVATFIAERKRKGWQIANEAQVELPSVRWGELIDYGDQRAREALFTRFGSREGLCLALPKKLKSLVIAEARNAQVAFVSDANMFASVTGLAAFLVQVRHAKLAAGREASALESAIPANESLALGASKASQLEKQLEQARALEDYQRKQASIVPLQEDLKRAMQNRKALETQLAGSKVRQNSYDVGVKVSRQVQRDEKLRRKADRLGRLVLVAEELAQALRKSGKCPCCAASLDAEARARKFEAKAETMLAEIEKINEALGRLQVSLEESDAALQVETVAKLLADENSVIDRLQKSIARINADIGKRPDYAGPTSSEVQAKLDRYRQSKAALDNAAILREEVEEARERAANLKRIETLVKEALDSLSEQTCRTAEEAVNKYMADGFEAAIDRESFRWGVRVNGVLRRETMSGSERSALLAALPLAWSQGSVSLVLYDDDDFRGLSREGVINFLQRLKAWQECGAIAQVIIARHQDRDDVPDGWHIVTTPIEAEEEAEL